MEASQMDLDYEVMYTYMAFIMTSEDETFYGEEQTFTTGETPQAWETLKV